MVGRSIEVSLLRFNDINVENVKDNNRCYNVAVQGIDRDKTSTYQELCIYPGREFILYDWYWSMAYPCTIDSSDDKFIFPEFTKNIFKTGGPRTDSNFFHMFRKIYVCFYGNIWQ